MMLKAVTPLQTKQSWLLLPIQEPFTINTIEFQSFTICHLLSQKQIQKWVYFNILFVYLSLIVFLFICLYIFGDLFKILLPLAFSITLSNIYYLHLVWKYIENDLNRIVDFLINLWNSFQVSFLNFINVLAMFFDNLPWKQVIRFMIWN